METNKADDIKKVFNTGLNRTMQYGNNVGENEESTEYSSLNRTMQYGNSSAILVQAPVLAFKSYYVVWKRLCIGREAVGIEV